MARTGVGRPPRRCFGGARRSPRDLLAVRSGNSVLEGGPLGDSRRRLLGPFARRPHPHLGDRGAHMDIAPTRDPREAPGPPGQHERALAIDLMRARAAPLRVDLAAFARREEAAALTLLLAAV